MANASYHGRFVWYDLMTTDLKGAEDFYTKVIGWGTQDFGPSMPYTMFTTGGNPIGGLGELPQEAISAGAPPHWISHVAVTDVDELVKDAAGLGAEILKAPELIPTVGRFSIVRDPQGAILSFFTPDKDAPGHEGPPEIGEFSWHELATTDHQSAYAYYATLFHWNKTEAMDMGEMGIYQMFGRGDTPLGGMFNRPPQMHVSMWLYYIRVPDVRVTLDKVTGNGGQVLNGPMEVPGGDLIAQCLDPQGAAFAIHSFK